MEEFELVFKVLESGPNGIETLSLLDRRFVILFNRKVLDVNEAVLEIIVGIGKRFLLNGGARNEEVGGISQSLDGGEKVSSGNGVNGVAELIV